MLVLFDNGAPRTLARYLIDRHAVKEAITCMCMHVIMRHADHYRDEA